MVCHHGGGGGSGVRIFIRDERGDRETCLKIHKLGVQEMLLGLGSKNG